MSNKYSSVNRTIIARNVLVKTITPPNNFSVSDSDFVLNTFCFSPVNFPVPYNKQSNMYISRLGLFSNLADGLVFDGSGFDIQITAAAITNYTLLTGTGLSVATGTPDLQVTGADGNLTGQVAANDVLINTVLNAPYMMVKSVTDNDNLVFTDDVEFTQVATGSWQKANLSVLGDINVAFPRMTVLNHMMAFDQFIDPSAFNLPGSVFDLVLWAKVTSSSPTAMNFKTLTIDSGFAGLDARFHVVADIEFTPA